MEEIKVDEYVRTKLGNIFKVTEDDVDYFNIAVDCTITKHSSNIIDLIEVGDYVNGYLINYIPTNEKAIYLDAADCEDVRCFINETIKSIVTKEQFTNIEYRIGENNE